MEHLAAKTITKFKEGGIYSGQIWTQRGNVHQPVLCGFYTAMTEIRSNFISNFKFSSMRYDKYSNYEYILWPIAK